MSRSVVIAFSLIQVTGCATLQPPGNDQTARTTVLTSEAPSLLQGEPLKNAELARYLAEYELARRGLDCRTSRVAVSFCDGVYTVRFRAVDRESPVEKYTVEINASDSRILRMTVTNRLGDPSVSFLRPPASEPGHQAGAE